MTAIQKLCRLTGWTLAEVDAVETNEAFAEQRLGGAIALDHPIGASGERVLVTLLHLMEDHDLHCGISSLCIGGGMGIAMAVER